MKMKLSITSWLALAALATLYVQPSIAFAQGTAFTYQGQLNANGSVASGIYDLRFTIYEFAIAFVVTSCWDGFFSQ